MTDPDLGTAYTVWRAAAFPKGSQRDDLDELHAQLAQWDSFVADAVVPVAESGAQFRSGQVDIAGGLLSFVSEAEGLAPALSGPDSDTLAQYLEYAHLLIDVYDAARRLE